MKKVIKVAKLINCKIKQEMLKTMLKKQRGITLVALVITVIIIIILATVTINMAFRR